MITTVCSGWKINYFYLFIYYIGVANSRNYRTIGYRTHKKLKKLSVAHLWWLHPNLNRGTEYIEVSGDAGFTVNEYTAQYTVYSETQNSNFAR